MHISSRLLSLVLVLTVLTLVAGCKKKEKPPELKFGAPAPDFVLNDLSGKAVRLSDYKGKIVLLEFWATWCPPCKLAIPELNELHEKYADSNLVILAVSMDEDIDSVKDFVADYDVIFPVLFDDKKISESFGIYTIPTALVLDEEGIVIQYHLGYAPGIFEELLKDVKDRL